MRTSTIARPKDLGQVKATGTQLLISMATARAAAKMFNFRPHADPRTGFSRQKINI